MNFSRPYGTCSDVPLVPALKRRAILKCPSGAVVVQFEINFELHHYPGTLLYPCFVLLGWAKTTLIRTLTNREVAAAWREFAEKMRAMPHPPGGRAEHSAQTERTNVR